MLIKQELPILWCDLETSGLQADRHGIIQMHLLFDNMGYIEDELHLDIQPFPEEKIVIGENEYEYQSIPYLLPPITLPNFLTTDGTRLDEDTRLEPHGITLGKLATFTPPKEAFNQLITWLNKHIDKFDRNDKADIGGFNVQFDLGFLTTFFTKNEAEKSKIYLGAYTTWRKLDPMYLLYNQAHFRFGKADNLSSFSLEVVAKHYDIEHIPHQVESDIKATRALWYILNGKHTIENCLCGKKGAAQWKGTWYCIDCYTKWIKERQ